MKIDSNLHKFNNQNLAAVNRQNNKQAQTTGTSVSTGMNSSKVAATPSFTGWFDMFLRYLDTNQAWGATFVDLGFMVLPRTGTDFTRNADAGIETLRREGSGNANHSMIGLYGTAAGLLLASGLNNAYGFGKNDIKASSIFADTETINLQGKIYHNALVAAQGKPEANPLKSYIRETLANYEALSPDKNAQWVRFNPEAMDKVTEILDTEIKSNSKKISKDALNQIKSILLSDSKVENNYRIIAGAGEKLHSSRYDLESVIRNIYTLGKAFSKEKVINAFMTAEEAVKNAAKATEPIMENTFLKGLKSMNLKRSILGIGIASAIGVSTQPLNMYLTKRKTGKSGFVGGGEEDKSTAFKFRKAAVAGLFGAGVLATIGNPKNLLKNLQFKGLSPTINQFKFIYGITIMSRFLSARNDNELKEASFKDVLGFANWLLLGNFVQKLVAQRLDKSLIKRDGMGILKWIQGSALKTRDEVLHAHLGKKAFDENGKALSYSKMLELADGATKTKLKYIKIAQLAGYVYSGLVLGIGIPKLNIYLTNRRMAKQKAAQDKLQALTPANNFLKPENVDFLRTLDNYTGAGFLR